jgi:L-histidine N-alpha-methyltransferase
MENTASIAVHESAYPEITRKRIADALTRREVEPSLLYAGLRQTVRWTALHHAISPAQRDPVFTAIYESAFGEIARAVRGNVVHVVSLACGDGTKDIRCLEALRKSGRTVLYTPADFSFEMALTARNNASHALRGLQCTPLVCELGECPVLPAILKNFDPSGSERVLLFLGTIHNYWPPDILRSLLYPLRSQDHLLISANLAPAEDYEAALKNILLQYDNAPTRDWLMGALSELDLSSADGALNFGVVPSEEIPDLHRIEASFVFARARGIQLFDAKSTFESGEKLRVFYSYRFTPAHLRSFFKKAGLFIAQEWMTPSQEEALFLCRREAKL